jgi:thiol-disulfide isomerase/thioredoxin
MYHPAMRPPLLNTLIAALRDPHRWQRGLRESALLTLILFAVSLAVGLWQNRDLPEGVAPPLAGMRTDGHFAQVGPGETARLVVFWATWCPVCRAEEGNIVALSRDWPVTSVAMQSGGAPEVAKYLKERNVPLPAIIDADGAIATDWRVRSVPAHFILDPAGIIRFRMVGYTTTPGLRARLWWAQNIPA